MVREAGRRLRELFLLDTRPNEFASGWLAFGWALFILFSPRGENDTLHTMSQSAPLWLWGAVVGLVGVVQIIGSAFGLTRLRTIGSFFIAPFWSYVTVIILLSGGKAAGFYAYAFFAGMCSWSYIRLVGDGTQRVLEWVRLRDERARTGGR